MRRFRTANGYAQFRETKEKWTVVYGSRVEVVSREFGDWLLSVLDVEDMPYGP